MGFGRFSVSCALVWMTYMLGYMFGSVGCNVCRSAIVHGLILSGGCLT